MAELVYAFDLKSNGEIHMGSSPISGTKSKLNPLSNRRIFTPKILATLTPQVQHLETYRPRVESST